VLNTFTPLKVPDSRRICRSQWVEVFGRRGRACWDNPQQSISITAARWATRAEAMAAVADLIERVYYRRERHSVLGMLTPVQFEQLQRQAEAA